MIHPEEEWVQVCNLTEDLDMCLTQEFVDLTSDLGSHRREFVAHLITHWAPEFSRMLDYFGPDDAEEDVYSGIDGQPMDVREDVPYTWELKEMPIPGLTCEWYRDIMRSKLVSIRLPVKLIKQYVEAFNKQEKN